MENNILCFICSLNLKIENQHNMFNNKNIYKADVTNGK
jgi:hypothetical protein